MDIELILFKVIAFRFQTVSSLKDPNWWLVSKKDDVRYNFLVSVHWFNESEWYGFGVMLGPFHINVGALKNAKRPNIS